MSNKRPVFTIQIKSHTDAPDYERTIQADNFSEAANIFYESLEGEYDMDFIKEAMTEE